MLTFSVFLCVLCGGEVKKSSFFRGFDSYTGLSFAMDDEASIKADEGVRLRFSGASLVLGAGLPSEKVGELGEILLESNPLDVLVPRVGLSVSLSPSFLPFSLSVNAGTLSFSGALSRMKSPVFPIGSSLSSPYRPSGGISSNLPSFTSSRHPFSLSVLLSSSGKSVEFPNLFFAADEKKELFLSIYKSFSLGPVPLVSLSANFSFLRHSREYSSSWFQKIRPYPEDYYFCSEIESSFVWSFVRHWSALCATQSPYGGFDFWFRTSDSLVLDFFRLNASFFASSPGLISASGEIVGVLYEFLLNPQFLFDLGNLSAQAGLSALGEIDSEKSAGVRFRFDAALGGGKFRAGLCAQTSLSGSDDSVRLVDFSSKLSASYRARYFSMAGSVSLKCSDSSQGISVSASVSPAKGLVKSLTSDLSLSIKDGNLSSSSVSAGMELCKKWEKITVTGKFSAKMKNTY